MLSRVRVVLVSHRCRTAANMETENLLRLVEDLREDIDAAEKEITAFASVSVDDRAASIPNSPRKAAGQYAVAAYTLGSTIFAYLRSEGSDPTKIAAELGRVRSQLERLEPPAKKE